MFRLTDIFLFKLMNLNFIPQVQDLVFLPTFLEAIRTVKLLQGESKRTDSFEMQITRTALLQFDRRYTVYSVYKKEGNHLIFMNIRYVLQYKRFHAHRNTKRTVNDLLKFLSLIAKLIMAQLTTKQQVFILFCFTAKIKTRLLISIKLQHL